ncbi:MBL fold metallo-hydrolase [Scatolibacter rhodanostii]|uniref:MBL fold metallo-hydrolase n=1 Tax=Scatolibacter rhodanostii TaxID=2014781 RepID=UPI000C08C761|nr:MBL fold metallo-hydrolase [Scatolibacter rhodanostii]
MARLCPLFSGSSGNSYYLGSKSAGVLIDAGRSAKQIDMMLKACEIDPLAVQGILVTHEHSDHISGVRVLAKKYDIPVFASAGTLRAMEGNLGETKTYIIEQDLQLADMEICHFSTSHDCAEPIGFRIKTADDRILVFSTDLGFVSQEVEDSLLGADFAVIESNHDEKMLKAGEYPYYLKRRILSDQGHLSNRVCSALLPKLAASGTTRFVLAHLSRDNNSPSVAKNMSLKTLTESGLTENQDFMLTVASPENHRREIFVF